MFVFFSWLNRLTVFSLKLCRKLFFFLPQLFQCHYFDGVSDREPKFDFRRNDMAAFECYFVFFIFLPFFTVKFFSAYFFWGNIFSRSVVVCDLSGSLQNYFQDNFFFTKWFVAYVLIRCGGNRIWTIVFDWKMTLKLQFSFSQHNVRQGCSGFLLNFSFHEKISPRLW